MKFGLFNYFPAGHYRKAEKQLLEELIQMEIDNDLEPDGGQPTVYAVFEEGYDQPLIQDWGGGQLNFLWKTKSDAKQFLESYMKRYDITDPDPYEVVELSVTGRINAERMIDVYWEEDDPDTESDDLEQTDFQEY